MTARAVSIFNTDGTLLGDTTIRHAVGMVVRQVATPHEWVEGRMFGPYPLMTSVMLVAAKYVYPKWLDNPAPYSDLALKARDAFRCAYCGGPGNEVEHVVPKSHGGRRDWLNTVCACRACNDRKANRTPEQAGMVLRTKPWVPRVRDLEAWALEYDIRLGRRKRAKRACEALTPGLA